jgi:tRNA-dihydrouridine synthase A
MSGDLQDALRARRGPLRPLSVAPMMDRTDRHFRYLVRRLTRRALLYTEMITTGALLHGDRDRFLAFHPDEHPLALQLGGDDPAELAACARMAADAGYDEVDLNVGCPSDRVQKGSFGVCLMARPERVAEAVAAMRAAVPLPVTVKHRIGFDQLDRYDDMRRFVEIVAAAGCDRFAVHARKAWLSGLNPKENREIPPLRYADVHRLKRELPRLAIEINGGFRTLEAVAEQLAAVDGVMLGRVAYEEPWMLAGADRRIYGDPAPQPTRRRVVEEMLGYVEDQVAAGEPLGRVTRHLLTLFAGCPGARLWRRRLSEGAHRPGAGAELVRLALEAIPDEVLDAPPDSVEAADGPAPALPENPQPAAALPGAG